MQDVSRVYDTRTQMMGPDADLPKSAKVLSRTITWSKRGIWVEADPRHVHEVISGIGLEKAN
eukprot:4872907-Lingulodinium_polyedra.AAC.1